MSLLLKLTRWIPSGLWMGLIFYLSSQSGLAGPEWRSIAAHIIEYGVLAGLYTLALTQTTGLSRKYVLILAVALATAYGISDEWHQSFVPNRVPDVFDILVDLASATTGALTINRLAVRLRSYSS